MKRGAAERSGTEVPPRHPAQSPARNGPPSLPAVRGRYHQGVAGAGPPQAAAQLLEQAVGHGLQGEHEQERAEEETVGGLEQNKRPLGRWRGRTHPRYGSF